MLPTLFARHHVRTRPKSTESKHQCEIFVCSSNEPEMTACPLNSVALIVGADSTTPSGQSQLVVRSSLRHLINVAPSSLNETFTIQCPWKVAAASSIASPVSAAGARIPPVRPSEPRRTTRDDASSCSGGVKISLREGGGSDSFGSCVSAVPPESPPSAGSSRNCWTAKS